MSNETPLQSKKPLDWKKLLRKNRATAKLVVVNFILYCASIGFGIDVLIGLLYHRQSFGNTLARLIHFQQPMYATLAGFIGASLFIFFFYLLHQKIMLLGLPVRRLDNDDQLSETDKSLVKMVETITEAMKLIHAPKVYLAEVPVPNVFVSGASENSQYIVITQGLVDTLNTAQLQAVIISEMARLKMGDDRLTLAIALVSHGSLIFFDSFFYTYLRKDDANQGITTLLFCKSLRMQRFMLPIGTFLFRFALRWDRVLLADTLAVQLMKDNKPLGEALSILKNLYHDRISFFRKAYANISHDEIRRESYFIDPANFNQMRTFATPFTSHPSIEERLEQIGYTASHLNH